VDVTNRVVEVSFETGAERRRSSPIERYASLEAPPDLTGISSSSLRLKRIVDVLVASVVLCIVSPLLAYVAWRIRRDSPGPILFRQARLGRDMHEFTILKFRTMATDADGEQHREYIRDSMLGTVNASASGLFKLERDEVITSFGRWLRRTSIDELPQLVNVLRGEMSLVGPRPCLPYEAEHFEPHHFERFLVPAGMTGLWQVTMRARATFLEALELDVAYVRRFSLLLDLRILLATPLQVLRQNRTT
jgi:lipopolysaccharide/colanic/teichoic acid biosynthesis glycosyltransferase